MNENDAALLQLLDQLPEYLRELTLTIASTLGVNPAMALPTLIAGMASGVHGLKAVRRPDGGVETLSLFQIVLSGPTTGKTRTHKLVHRAHTAHDIMRYEEHQASKEAGDVRPLRDVLQPLTNSRALLEGLEGVGNATAISTHEGQSVLEGYFFRRQLGIATVLWDGEDKVVLPRAHGGRLIALDASLNMLLMLQPEIFLQHLGQHGGTARSIGFLPRCLFTLVPANLSGFDWSQPGSDSALTEFHKDVAGYLEKQHAKQKTGRVEREIVEFSASAKLLWLQLDREAKQCHGTQYPWIQEAINRVMQNVTRLAGVIHAYFPRRPEDTRNLAGAEEEAAKSEEISVATLKAAWALAQWHLRQFMQFFPPQPVPPPPPPKPSARDRHLQRILEDADTIILHFKLHCGHTGESSAPKSAVLLRSGLYPMRFNPALIYLTDENYMVMEGEGRQARLREGGRPYVPPNG